MKIIEIFSISAHKEWLSNDPHLSDLEKSPFLWMWPIFNEVKQLIEEAKTGSVHVLRGPRQVGKTTFLKKILDETFKGENSIKKALFVQGDWITDFKDLDQLLRTYFENNEIDLVIIDEVTFIEQWQRAIKGWFDEGLTRSVQFLVTGSNAFDLKKQAELLPGRRGEGKDFELLPMSFKDYSIFCQSALKCENPKSLFELFLITGGFPHAVREYIETQKTHNSQETYLRWIKGDFLKAGKSDVLLKELFFALLKTLNNPVGLDDLQKRSSMNSHNTVKDYIEFSKSAFIISELARIRIDEWNFFPRKNKKYYFRDPLIFRLALNWVNQPVSEDHIKGYLCELCIAEHLHRMGKRLGYYHDAKKQEIDFFGSDLALEVKSSNHVSDIGLIKSVNHSNKLLISMQQNSTKIEEVNCIPIWDYLLEGTA